MGNIITALANFLKDIFNAILALVTWIGDLAEKIYNIELATSGIVGVLGTYRYLVGDTIYMIHITTFYIGIFLMAIKTIPIIVSWWKHFSPFN